tara:strand:+ start:695 stop:1297 length:603 start_codon:yes stop_codon:yes gene_type:complete
MPYGYLGQTPNQQFKNSGVFSVGDAKALTDVGQLGGSLELIQEQTFSSTTTIDFTSIKGNKYDVMVAQLNDVQTNGGNDNIDMRFYESGVLETASVYQYALQYGYPSTFGETRSTGADRMVIAPNQNSENTNGYIYFYNLNNSSKYSFYTVQTTNLSGGNFFFYFGGGVLPQASVVDGIRFFSDTYNLEGSISLFGEKQI